MLVLARRELLLYCFFYILRNAVTRNEWFSYFEAKLWGNLLDRADVTVAQQHFDESGPVFICDLNDN